jgi:hypothetical protein
MQDTFQELKDTLCREGLPMDDDTIDEYSHAKDIDETSKEDEVLVSTLPFDEDIQASVPLAHQEENMMSHNPLEKLDDALFHDFGSEEVLEEPSDTIDPFEKRK